MKWHTVKFDEKAKTVEIYRHASDYEDGDPLILIERNVAAYDRSPEGAEALAGWIGRILLVDNPALMEAVGLK
ncbi:MAG: hypothetical protein R3C52_12125 [Hyphomonadaceae bacterium]